MGKKTPSKRAARQNFDYISNDPEENADNFDPKWASFKELNTDEERYQAIRKRWGNADIPDPQINLTCRQITKHCESEEKKSRSDTENKENIGVPSLTNIQNRPLTDKTSRRSRRRSRSCTRDIQWDSEAIENFPTTYNGSEPNATVWPLLDGRRRNRQVSKRRSRSCTRPYERLISDLEKTYTVEYSQLICRQSTELQEMLHLHFQRLGAYGDFYWFEHIQWLNLKIQQKQEVMNLLSNHYNEAYNLLGKKNENIEACIRYMEEVKAFFTFYQKINDAEVTLQMTDEQYEHTVETERMYASYNKFYK